MSVVQKLGTTQKLFSLVFLGNGTNHDPSKYYQVFWENFFVLFFFPQMSTYFFLYRPLIKWLYLYKLWAASICYSSDRVQLVTWHKIIDFPHTNTCRLLRLCAFWKQKCCWSWSGRFRSCCTSYTYLSPWKLDAVQRQQSVRRGTALQIDALPVLILLSPLMWSHWHSVAPCN